MLRLGSRVQVVKRGDETFPEEYMFRKGRVTKFDNTNCGATPKDPMVIVEFRNGKHDGFWPEELKEL